MTYENYKNSPLSWLPDAPEHWDFIKFKYLFKEINEKSSTGGEDLLSVSQYTGVTHRKDKIDEEKDHLTNAESLEGYKKVSVNDLVINIMLAWNGSLGFSPFEGIVSPAYCVYRVTEKALPKYFHYLLRTDFFKREFKKVSTGVIDSRLRMYTEDFFTLKTPVPPLAEQLAISDFLDGKLSEIDIFMQKKQQLINLLQERKAVFINQILANTEGVVWKKLKFVAKVLRGKFSHRPRNDESLYGGQYPFIQTGDVARADKYVTSYTQTLNEAGYKVTAEFPTGTLLMTIAATIAEVAILGFNSCFPDSIVGFYPKEGLDKEYLYYVLKSQKQIFVSTAVLNTQLNLNVERIQNLKIPVPPLSIQSEIVLKIQFEHLEIDKAINTCRREIELVKEYREVLIAEAVTGKIKVTKS